MTAEDARISAHGPDERLSARSAETAQPVCVIGTSRTYCHLRGIRYVPRPCVGSCDLEPEQSTPADVNDQCAATTESGVPCKKRGPHAGHWFMSDGLWACLNDDHFDPANVLSRTPLVHLDVPCLRAVAPPAEQGECGCAETCREALSSCCLCGRPRVVSPLASGESGVDGRVSLGTNELDHARHEGTLLGSQAVAPGGSLNPALEGARDLLADDGSVSSVVQRAVADHAGPARSVHADQATADLVTPPGTTGADQ